MTGSVLAKASHPATSTLLRQISAAYDPQHVAFVNKQTATITSGNWRHQLVDVHGK